MQLLVIAGNIGKDPALRTTQSGDKVLGFSIAVDNGKDRDGNKRDATWYDCSVWGKRAESLGWLSKGMKLTVSGRPTARAHDGKAYLGISVDQITAQGGGQDRDNSGGGYSQQPNSGPGAGGGFGGGSDLDDEIPFNWEGRI
jgi:single-strand DNA-binding protein